MPVPDPERPLVRARLQSFHELMQQRVQRILLVSSLYDSFIMSEEGHLHESLLSQFIDLNLTHTPDLVQVSSGAAALEWIQAGGDADLVVTSVTTGDGDAAGLVRSVREAGYDVPVIGLAYTNRELRDFMSKSDPSLLERVFLWQGDVRILLAMVMYLEDRLNVENDTGVRGVPAIIVVEDNVRFYSSFMPAIYGELFRHTHRLLSEDLNLSQKMMRMRARPKVLLCDNYEEAKFYFERYEEQVLGIVSDFEFPLGGKLEKHAGLTLCTRAHAIRPDIRLVMQSSLPDNRALAEEIGASFLLKGSPVMLHQLRSVLVERFGFGDFVFRDPDGSEVDRAEDLRALRSKLRTVPAETIAYHAERNHFSNWLKARTEFALAERLRPQKLEDFDGTEALRAHLMRLIDDHQSERNRTVIAEFDHRRFDPSVSITRIGGGSLGGKARGVAFASRILNRARLSEDFPDVDIRTPPFVVLGTEVFDEFLEWEGLHDFAISPHSDRDIERVFGGAPFPRRADDDLRAFVQRIRYPVAVRSSSLLEDSLSQPFAGVYRTYMLPNNDAKIDVRWMQLVDAVKRVYASAFAEEAKAYLSMTSYRLEEEKMAVMIQELVGKQHGERFYPDFAGVARSYNFYPEPGHSAEDGVVAVALGMGRMVVGGEPCLRFNPKHPRQIVTFSSVEDALKNSQRQFYALNLKGGLGSWESRPYSLEVAEEDGPLAWMGSTYSPENQVIVDGISRPGVRLVSFAQILKHGAFPLAEILNVLLERCQEGTGGPVEIEFAGNLASQGQRAQLAFLQLRPLALSKESEEVEIGSTAPGGRLCYASRVLGNGRVDDVHDLVVVDPERFDRQRTPEIAQQVARFDAILRKEGRPYVLIGVGRWGSSDPLLGIPVTWSQIAGTRVIVEAGLPDLKVEPSQGTHFFQNLSASNVGYFTVNPDVGEGSVDWGWLADLEPVEETEFVRLYRAEAPLIVKMSGRTGEGVILKPGAGG